MAKKKPDIPDQVIDAAMALAAERGWRGLTLADIAEAAKLPLSKVYPVFRSKSAILNGLRRQVDAAVMADCDRDADEGGARDRLFDVLMRRFDALQPYKDGLGNVIYDQSRDPCAALCGLSRLSGSMALMLEAAGISSSGPCGALRVRGLSAIYLATLRDWLRDDSADKAQTMAVLDRRLRRAETLLSRLPRRRRGPGSRPGTETAPA